MPIKNRQEEAQMIVGIGASANGINAMEGFFKNVPENTGLTFVVIQHLSPDHKSILPEILQKKTKLKVLEIEDNASPQPNHVYVLPAGSDVTFSENRFHLHEYSKNKKGLHLPIDRFFRSLAADRKDKTAAILLTGSGSDGLLGIREIKNEGGLVLAQDPASAKFKSMPQSAIESGLVDKTGTPEELPDLLLSFQKNVEKEDRAFDHSDSQTLLRRLFQLLRSQSGHDFTGYKKNTIFRRIRRRMSVNKKSTLQAYVQLLEDQPSELDYLFRELLIGVTSFFRNKDAFDILTDKVFPKIISADSNEPVRIWVAACATGEEAYSIAILAREFQESKRIRIDMQIFATDVDPKALETARAGRYKQNIESDVPGHLLKKYFQKRDDVYQIHKDIRDMITFAEHSTTKDAPYSKLDLVSCRNFLIYLESDIQKHVLNKFHYALLPERYLFLGHSETHTVKNEIFEPIDMNVRIYQKKENQKAVTDYLAETRKMDHQVSSRENRLRPDKKKLTLKEFAENKALKEYLQPFLLIDKKGDIHYSLGKCDKYFSFYVGEPNQNIVKLAREGLKIPVSNALRKINAESKPVSFNDVKVSTPGGPVFVNVILSPVDKPSLLSHLIIVTIEPSKKSGKFDQDKNEDIAELSRDSDEYIRHMEQELEETREYLNSVIEELETSNEELKSSNEEAQATNEELQSTNEELETSKEELQSLNEELETANNELQGKIEEVTEINNDLNNFLQSTHIATLFLDKNLKIRRFSPKIKDFASLVESDIGRSIENFGITFSNEQLVKDIQRVLDKLSPVEKEVSKGEDEHYWMRILPYRTIEDRIDGVVITFTDITEKYKVRQLREQSERWKKYKHLFDHLDHGFALFQTIVNKQGNVEDFRLVEANKAYEDMMNIHLSNEKNKTLTELPLNQEFSKNLMKTAKKVLALGPHQEECYFRELDKYFKILYFTHEEEAVAVFIQDITNDVQERKAEAHLASIVESSDDAIFSESPEGKILSWNEGATQLYGYTEDEAIGTSAKDLYAYPQNDGDMAMIKLVATGKKVKNRETEHKRKNSDIVSVSVTKSPIKDDNGKVVAISNIVKDISEVKEREAELVKAKESSEQAASLKSLFLANMSHEIRTPLNSILGFTDILREKITGEKQKNQVENIYHSGKQLLHLIDDIVDVSRLDAGELPLHKTSVDINEIIRKIKNQFEGYVLENKKGTIDFRLKLPNQPGEYIVTDKQRLQQILHNLLSNAFKYTNEGYVELGYEVNDKREVQFYVRDSGIGISLENQEKIFDRFQQIPDNPKESDSVIRGTGLGLAIARGLTVRLGGKIWVESEKDRGSTFYFTIPYEKGIRSKTEHEQTKKREIRVPKLDGKKIIIAEDDMYSLEMIKYMLDATNATYFVAEDGEQTLDLFYNEKVDLLMLDIRLPKIDGYELIREIRKTDKDIPVIAQSAFALPEQIKKSKDLGFSDHLVKPLSQESFYGVLEKYLAGRGK